MKSKKSTTKRRIPAHPTPSVEHSTDDLYQKITERAHEIDLQGSHQGPLEDWLQAEREILQGENQNPD